MKHDKKNRKAFHVVLSILIAVAIWLYVVNVENPTGTMRLHDVPITIVGSDVLEEQNLMVTSVSRDSVTLKLNGKKRTFMKLDRENTSVRVDVSFITEPGEYTVSGTPKYPENVSAENVTVMNWSDLTMTVTVEETETRTIPVKGEFIGVEAKGYEAGTVTTDPSEIRVRGPKSQMDGISYALVQAGGDEVKDDVVCTEPLVLMKAEKVPVEDTNLLQMEEKEAEVRVPVRRVTSLPLTVELVGEETEVSCTIKPDRVTVIDTGKLPESLSLGKIDLKKISNDTELVFSIPCSEGVTLWNSPEKAVVRITLK